MTADAMPVGPRPPQQARSREALRRILAAAENVLASDGFNEFTVAAVAEQAGVSVGALYRRFASKEQLLDAVKERMLSRLEQDLEEALTAAADRGLREVVSSFTAVLGAAFAADSRVYPALIMHGGAEGAARGVRAYLTMERLFVDAAAAHLRDVRRRNARKALSIVARTILAACVQRTISLSWGPENISWKAWQTEMTAMATSYLTTADGQTA